MERVEKTIGAERESFSSSEDVRIWQQQLVQGVLRVLVIIGPLAAAAGSYYDYTRQVYSTIPLYWVAYAILLLITFWRRVPYAVQAVIVIFLIYGLALLDFPTDGRGGSGRVFLLVLPFMTGIFFGGRASVVALLVVLATMVGYGWAFSTGLLTVSQEIDSADPAGWLSNTLVLMMMGTFVVVAHNHLVPRLVAALNRSQKLTEELREQQCQLQVQVEERTVALSRRGAQLEAAAQIARDATAIQDVDQLLAETVRLVSDRFGFYHTGIFLLDEAKEYAILHSASSEGGQRMLDRGHRLRVGEAGIVGYVTKWGEPRIALDVGQDAHFFDNPDLPATRSEIALPLRVRDDIIGALDVQSTKPGAFGAEDTAVLQTLADQIAMAINNAQLFRQAQESLEAERRAYGELSQRAWQELLRGGGDLAQRYDPQGILPPSGQWRETLRQAVHDRKSVADEQRESVALAIPIQVREQVIGVLDAHKPKEAGGWTDEEIALIQTLVDQLSVALDSARLYQDAQRRAVRERLIGDTTARMRESLELETLLKTAATEMRRALDLKDLVIRLATPEEDEPMGEVSLQRR